MLVPKVETAVVPEADRMVVEQAMEEADEMGRALMIS